MKKRLAVISTHPIQYNVPLFRLLTQRGNIEVKVFYTWGNTALDNKYDPGFGKVINWDIPLLEGYSSEFLDNKSKQPGSHHFNGIVNPAIISRIRSWKPDAILVYGWNFNSHLKVLRHFKKKVPVFFRGDSTLLDDRPGLKSLIRKTILRWIYRHIDKAFYVGKNNKDYFRMASIKEHGLILAPHAVDNEFFSDNSAEKEEEAQKWRLDLGIEEQDTVFLFAGKFEPKKSPLLLLESFKRAGFSQKVRLIFVGNGELEERLKSSANTPDIHFIDFQNQRMMPVVYRLADVFILPSGGPGETWGLAINEAMASGRSVIASTMCGGAIDLIKPGVTGYIFEAGNASDLQEKMLLMIDKKMSRAMGVNAQQRIQQFSLTQYAERIEQAVSGLFL